MPVEKSESTVKKEFKEFPIVPEGMYAVEVADVILKKGIETQWGLKNYFYIYMGVIDTNQRGSRIFYKVSTSFTAGFQGGQQSKLYEFACTVHRGELQDTAEFDVNSLINGRLTVVIKHTKSNDKTYADVVAVLKADDRVLQLPPLTEEEIKALLPQVQSRDNTLSDDELDKIAIDLDNI